MLLKGYPAGGGGKAADSPRLLPMDRESGGGSFDGDLYIKIIYKFYYIVPHQLFTSDY